MMDKIIREDIEVIKRVVKGDAFEGKNTLVTGGAGFIGSWLCDLLVDFGAEVTVVDDLSTGNIKNIDHLNKHKQFKFIESDVCAFRSEEKFDYIFMSDVIEHLEKPEAVFGKISRLMHKDSIFVNTMANPGWEPILMVWEKLGWKMPEGPHNRTKYQELRIIMKEAGLKVTKHNYTMLIPIYIPFVSAFMNKYLEKPFKRLAFIEYITAIKNE